MKKQYFFFAAALLSAAFTYAQNAATPNAGFETWTHTSSTVAYDDATGWNDLNSTTAGFGSVTCYKATAAGDFHSGTAAIKLVTTSVFGQNANGIATTGTINTSTQAITGGIAYTGRPDSIAGWFKSTPGSSDRGFIQLLLTGTSDTDTIGYVIFRAPSSAVSSYIYFSAPVWYKSTNPVTKSQWILSSSKGASGQQVGTTIYVDDLNLVFNPAGIQEEELLTGFHVGPNPAMNTVQVFNTKLTRGYIALFEVSGRKVATYQVNEASNAIDVTGLPQGIFLYTIFDEQGKALNNGKLLIQK
jgi:hypothetical protein